MRPTARLTSAVVVAALAAGAFWWWRSNTSAHPRAESTTGPASGDRRPAPARASELAAPPRISPDRRPPEDPGEVDPDAIDPADVPADWPTKLPAGYETARLRLDGVDALTGTPVDATWSLVGPSQPSPPPGVEAPVGPPEDLSSTTDDRRRRASVAAAVLLHDRRHWIRLDVDAAGYGRVRHHGVSFAVAAGVSELRFRAPMDRLTALHAIVLGPDGRPAVGAVIYEVRVAGAFVRVESDPSDERGSLEVRGIPYLPDEPIGAFVGWEPPGAGRLASSNPVRRPFDLTSVVPTDPARGWSEVVRLSGPSSSGDDGDRAGWRGEDPPDVTFSEPDVDLVGDDSDDPKTPRGAIRVRVLGWDGKPVARPSLRCVGVGRVSCGADGLVTLDECTVGVHDVRFDAEGRLPATARVVVAAGQSTDIVLREPVGARVDVSCVDVRGRPCSSAELEIETKHRGPILDVTDGVQRLDPFADERGRRTFARVSPDVIRVRARWGSRSGEAVFDVKDGETKDVRVVVK